MTTPHRPTLHSAERLVFFSDAVFAIAMTLLVLDLKVPEFVDSVTRADVDAALAAKAPGFIAFLISFLVLAAMWVTHHHRFAMIERVDWRTIQLDLALLFFVALLPMPTGLIFGPTADSPWPVALYAGTVGLGFLLLNLIWQHAHAAGLAEVSDTEYLRSQWATTPVWAIFLISVPVAFLSSRAAMLLWMALAVVQPIAERIARRRFPAQPDAAASDSTDDNTPSQPQNPSTTS